MEGPKGRRKKIQMNGKHTGDLWRKPKKELVGPEAEQSDNTEEEDRRAAIVDPIQRTAEPGMMKQVRVFNPKVDFS